MSEIQKLIAASGIELWSETDSDLGEGDRCEFARPAYLQVKQDAGIGKNGSIASIAVGKAVPVKVSASEVGRLIEGTKKGILVSKTANDIKTPEKNQTLEERKTPATAAKSEEKVKVKKRVTFDPSVSGKLEKPFLHSASDANRDTIEQGKAALADEVESSSEDESDLEEDGNPYKRRRVDHQGYVYAQRSYGVQAKMQEKRDSSLGCQRLIILVKCMFTEQNELLDHLDERNSVIKDRLQQIVPPEVFKSYMAHRGQWNNSKSQLKGNFTKLSDYLNKWVKKLPSERLPSDETAAIEAGYRRFTEQPINPDGDLQSVEGLSPQDCRNKFVEELTRQLKRLDGLFERHQAALFDELERNKFSKEIDSELKTKLMSVSQVHLKAQKSIKTMIQYF